jgi:hypothetical protein
MRISLAVESIDERCWLWTDSCGGRWTMELPVVDTVEIVPT